MKKIATVPIQKTLNTRGYIFLPDSIVVVVDKIIAWFNKERYLREKSSGLFYVGIDFIRYLYELADNKTES